MSKKQKTIQNEISLSGVGLHTGNNVTLTFKPAAENHVEGGVYDVDGEGDVENFTPLGQRLL